jgi:bifunctional DNA-binding transcriptional regulator/antitoxin component of YhaV-PrlF toxin-antitoxin module
MAISELDSKGRLTLRKETRERLKIGKRVLVVSAEDHLKVIPLPEDPFAVLDGAISLRRAFSELRTRAEDVAMEEAGRKVR